MNITDISIDDLWPGEIVISREKFDENIRVLELGNPLRPITIICLEGKNIVRDGNTRVRAFIEFHEKHKKVIENISCKFFIPDTKMSKEEVKKNYRKLAMHYGKGIEAFKKLPIANSDEEYNAEQYKVQQILDSMEVQEALT